MRFGVLGPVQVWSADGRLVPVPEAKVRAILAALLMRNGTPATTGALIEEVWETDRPAAPERVLRSKISRLRGVLDSAEPGGRDRLVHRPGGYALRFSDDELDALRFRALVEHARASADPDVRAAALEEALDLWRGPALADAADTTALRPWAEHLEEDRLTAIEERADARTGQGRHPLLADELGALAEAHPLRERIRAAHMRALYRAGRQTEALESYERLRAALAEELGVDPSPELAELHGAILRQDPGLLAEPAKPAAPARSGLPAPLDEFVGREADLADLRRLLAEGRRLVTLTGPGGVGKTRLAVEAGRAAAADFDATWFVELGHLPAETGDDPDRLADAVAYAVGIRDESVPRHARGLARLAGALSGTRGLLVLDNCEHLLGAAAPLIRSLREAAPDLHLLATSREPLRVRGEWVYQVAPLRADGDGSAVRLFAVRAAASAPGFRLDARTEPVVAAICRRLDGLPLALELAANRVRALGVATLAAGLDDRFALLASGERDAPERLRTLRAMIDWSWDLLEEDERVALRRVSVFSDGFTPEAAAAVLGRPATGSLARLAESSLAVPMEGADGVRFRLLETIAAYAAERLEEAGEAGLVRERHMRFHVEFAERADVALRGADQALTLRRLDESANDLRAAFAEALRTGDAHSALRLAVGGFWYRWLRGRLGEAHRTLTSALALPGGPPGLRALAAAWRTGLELGDRDLPDPAARAAAAVTAFQDAGDRAAQARAWWFMGPMLMEVGEQEAAEWMLAAALADFRERGDRWGVAAVLCNRAWLALMRGRADEAGGEGRRALALFEELGDGWGRLEAMAVLRRHAEAVGDHAESARIGEAGLALSEELGLVTKTGHWLAFLGRSAMLAGDLERAAGLLERAHRLSVRHGDIFGRRFAGLHLGALARRQGRSAEAETLLEAWLGERGGEQPTEERAMALTELGFAALARGDAAAALTRHRRALATARSTASGQAVAAACAGLAATAAALGRGADAALLLGAAAGARGGTRPAAAEAAEAERIAEAVRKIAGADEFDAQFEQGRRTGVRSAENIAASWDNALTEGA
ncbi:BTAD domain-containing putative transcriptional regulator [Streptomonospora nanhaiensis]|uniref:Putative ATPase/DNA-binding SARP family transcriptional activator n=5 Tax=Streptomonospora nanhaiensis TaxID=1323731 RepID=A0A853BWC0_9ACTN|nr:BTAD domain-containing putative transcriptional regulator [Streptomonospora nanhaiensis]MBV2367018.1 winged helix-turn-helix domain-containing protein [Streptomonospora nanhaiensis]NYI99045.1 putative ATPase/DNA-binding SARP family transcriptional activator [Streptomonospora nanhaiensis]